VNAPASTFLYKGKQHVVVLAGGTALAGSKRSDGLWLFSLDGTMDPLPRGSADPTSVPRPGPPPAAAPAARVPNKDKGKEIYTKTCVVCHGENGKGGTHGGAPFTPKLTHDSVVAVLTRGRNDMPPFGSALSPEQLEDLTAWVLDLAVR
jgi:mono/diheme cytochrome c family protein